jgi:hypothetical protein
MDWPLFNICLLTLVIHLIGALAVPTVQRWFTAAIADFQHHRSVVKLLWSALTPTGAKAVAKAVRLPSSKHRKI